MRWLACASARGNVINIDIGLFRELNPGPPAPEAGIIPLDQTAKCGAKTPLR